MLRHTALIVVFTGSLLTARVFGQIASPHKSVAVEGARLAVVESGEGVPVVFVHGGMQDLRMWSAHTPVFAKRYRTIAYSRRNHFPNEVSPAGTQDLAADSHGDDAAVLIRAMGLPAVHIVAHSSGAHAALFLAARHPDLVRTLTLVEPPASGLLTPIANGSKMLKQFADRFAPARDAFRAGDLELGARLFADGVGGPGTYDRRSAVDRRMMIENADAHIADATSTLPRPQFTCDMARTIRVPALLLRGERSPDFFGVMLQELARCLPRNQVVVVSGASHTVPLENPSGFQAAVLAFLEQK